MKSIRQKKILNVIENQAVSTQKELADALIESGFEVTQATVSRDIRELNLIKIPVGENIYRYAAPQEAVIVSEKKFEFVLKEFVINVDYSDNIVIVKTAPANANVVAYALDNFTWKEVIGTVAGDDTILLVVKPKEPVEKSVKKVREYTEN